VSAAKDLRARIETAIGAGVTDVAPLSGGCVGEVYRARLADGETIVVKVDDRPQPQLSVEGYMLTYLADHSNLPVPAVLHSSDRLLLLEFLPGDSRFSRAAQRHAAELLADLHGVSGPAFGLERDTLIGGLHQPNLRSDSWLEFFRQQRLLYMAAEGVKAGRLPAMMQKRLQAFGERLGDWLMEPERPSLIHGDVWTSNVLAVDDHITGFIDPAVYYAHPEIELAFATLFGTFDQAFCSRYQEIRPIPAGFFEERRDIYNLYPLLVHVRLFGGSYVRSVDRVLSRFGF
jgi:fructosamine-3-kinase